VHDTVTRGISETESELNQLAQASQPASAQLELGLDSAAQAPAQKQA